ncbi:hypothetical protein QOT17_001430 [Balamuthia mandrillaris]
MSNADDHKAASTSGQEQSLWQWPWWYTSLAATMRTGGGENGFSSSPPPDRFRPSAELIVIEDEGDEDKAREERNQSPCSAGLLSSQEETPPEDYAAATAAASAPFDLPSFATLYTVPPEFVSAHLRNRKEAQLLLDIADVAQQLDSRLDSFISSLEDGDSSEGQRREEATTPTEEELTFEERYQPKKRIKAGAANLAECIHRLSVHKTYLSHYGEVNATLAQELVAEGESCRHLAQEKALVSRAENFLLRRLELLLSGEASPYKTSSLGWDNFLLQQKEELLSTPPTKEGKNKKRKKSSANNENAEKGEETDVKKQNKRKKGSSSPLKADKDATTEETNKPAAAKQGDEKKIEKAQRQNEVMEVGVVVETPVSGEEELISSSLPSSCSTGSSSRNASLILSTSDEIKSDVDEQASGSPRKNKPHNQQFSADDEEEYDGNGDAEEVPVVFLKAGIIVLSEDDDDVELPQELAALDEREEEEQETKEERIAADETKEETDLPLSTQYNGAHTSSAMRDHHDAVPLIDDSPFGSQVDDETQLGEAEENEEAEEEEENKEQTKEVDSNLGIETNHNKGETMKQVLLFRSNSAGNRNELYGHQQFSPSSKEERKGGGRNNPRRSSSWTSSSAHLSEEEQHKKWHEEKQMGSVIAILGGEASPTTRKKKKRRRKRKAGELPTTEYREEAAVTSTSSLVNN